MSQPPAYDPGSATNRDLDPHHTLPAPYGSDATETDPARLLPAWAQQPRPKGSWVRKIVLLLIILGIIGIVVWRIQASKAETAATANKAAQAANRPTPVQTTAVQMKTDQAAIEAAKVNLSYTSIYSPINGVVGLRAVDPGNIVHASDSTGLVVITQIHPIAIIFTLPEDQLPQVQQAMRGGKKLVVEAYDRNDAHKIASGTLLTIDNQIDTTTGTAKLKAVFDNADGSLFPNQFVNVRLITQERENAIVVPTAAIQTGTQGTFVFVVHDGPGKEAAGSGGAGGSGKHRGGGTASATPDETASAGSAKGGKSKSDGGPPPGPPKHANTVNVTVDFTQGSNSILSPGAVNAGDQVIVDGQEKLTDGSNVTPQAAVSGAGKSGRGIGASAATGALGPGSNTGAPAGGGNRP